MTDDEGRSGAERFPRVGQTADVSCQQAQMQMLFDKIDELINSLRR